MCRVYLDLVGGIFGDFIIEDVEMVLDFYKMGYELVYVDRFMVSGFVLEIFDVFI